MTYTDQERTADYHFYKEHLNDLYLQYGHCFLAIQNGSILGSFPTAGDAADRLSPEHPFGTYIIQECSDDPDVYITDIMRFRVDGVSV